jgi:gas vesicle protein
MRNDTGDRVLWLLTGLGIGAGVALLFAPKTGRDTRRYLRRLAEDSKDRLAESGSDVADKSRQAYERGRAVVDEALEFVDRGRRTILRQS